MYANIRLAAIDLVTTRFVGRAQLRRRAEHDVVALVELEVRLGLATAGELEGARLEHALVDVCKGSREYVLAHWLLSSPAPVRRLAWFRFVEAAAVSSIPLANACKAMGLDQLRTQGRAARLPRTEGCDPLASRAPWYAERTIARRRARELVAGAAFRIATHGHESRIEIVDRGSEGASSSTNSVRPQSVGLPNAYAKHGYFVTQSSHGFRVSSAILTAEVRELNDAAPRGVLYLRSDLRVTQGRGTALVVQSRAARGRWS